MSIILIGFKHVGKTVLGKSLAQSLGLPFIDLDSAIEQHEGNPTHLSCRTLMQIHGEAYFRQLETTILTQVLQTKEAVIALGGGTPLQEVNQRRMQGHQLIQITAPPQVVFERIMLNGVPAFFPTDRSPLEAFNELWAQRQKIYQQLTSLVIENQGTIAQGTEKLRQVLKGRTP